MRRGKEADKEFLIDEGKCIKCGMCVRDCAARAIEIVEYPEIDNEKCFECGHCLAVCPTEALSILGKKPSESLTLTGRFPERKAMETLIKGRRSVRQYRDESVDKKVINDLFEIVNHAPTATNSQLIHYIIIDDKEVMKSFKEEVYSEVEKFLENTPVNIEELKGSEAYIFKMLGAAVKGYRSGTSDMIFRGAPHLVITSTPKAYESGLVDAVIALSYFDLLAPSASIGTVWNGIATNIFKKFPQLLERLSLPEEHNLCYVMGFGKAKIEYKRSVERDAGNITTFKL